MIVNVIPGEEVEFFEICVDKQVALQSQLRVVAD